MMSPPVEFPIILPIPEVTEANTVWYVAFVFAVEKEWTVSTAATVKRAKQIPFFFFYPILCYNETY
jgi:hypothetical protein